MAEEKKEESSVKSSSSDKTLAILAHALGIITGFIGALIIYLMQQKEGFVKDNAKKALNFQLTLLIGYVAAWILSFLIIGIVFLPLLWLANLIFCIMAAVAVSQDKVYNYPVKIDFVK